jgi:hypothetical protein
MPGYPDRKGVGTYVNGDTKYRKYTTEGYNDYE